MDFTRESSPPPAYSERDYDRKLAATFQMSLTISEDPEEEADENGSEDVVTSRAPETVSSARAPSAHAHSFAPTSSIHKLPRRLPAVPGQQEAIANQKPLRIHKKSASHSYGSYPAPIPHAKLYGALDPIQEVSNTTSRSPRPQNSPSHHGIASQPSFPAVAFPVSSLPPSAGSRSQNPSSENRFLRSNELDQHRPSPPLSPHNHSFPSRSSHPRTVPQLQFDASVAYTRPEFSPASSSHSDSTHDHITFNPNSFYNSAVSSQLNASPSPSLPARLKTHGRSASSSTHFTAARPPSEASAHSFASFPLRSQHAQSPSTPYSSSTTHFPLHPSYASNTTPTAHDRWATSEDQFVHI
ncbi:hypothetical protein GYMLUDRAFT_36950 [Collybiopsis luxurians FD-317 M1]|nr:hypothetical protein GYMLUDRAFT_36950 [Collybiopsis luxurians FD-317 M1]